MLPPCVVDGCSRNPLYYYYYFCFVFLFACFLCVSVCFIIHIIFFIACRIIALVIERTELPIGLNHPFWVICFFPLSLWMVMPMGGRQTCWKCQPISGTDPFEVLQKGPLREADVSYTIITKSKVFPRNSRFWNASKITISDRLTLAIYLYIRSCENVLVCVYRW